MDRRRSLLLALAALCILAVTVPVAIGAGPRLSVSPTTVPAGEDIRVRGTGWPARRLVTLYLGRSRTDNVRRIGRVRTSRRGSFRKRVIIDPDLAPGRWVVLACRRQCRLKRTRAITVVDPSPYGGID